MLKSDLINILVAKRGVTQKQAEATIETIFESMKDANPAERQKELSAGIAEAMYNTAMGLGIALLCMVAHLMLSTASKKVVSDLESFSLKLENLLGEGQGGQQQVG